MYSIKQIAPRNNSKKIIPNAKSLHVPDWVVAATYSGESQAITSFVAAVRENPFSNLVSLLPRQLEKYFVDIMSLN